MSGMDFTAAAALVKEYYNDGLLENTVFKDNKFLELVRKDRKAEGKDTPVPVIYGNPQNRSVDFATMKAGTTSTSSKQFVVTRAFDYSKATISREIIKAASTNKGAYLDVATMEIDNALKSLERSIGIALWRSGWGDIGVISAISTNTLNLTLTSDALNFEVGQVVQFASTQASSTLRNSGGTNTVLSVDTSAGTVTLSGTPTSGTAVGDYIFSQKDRQDSATPAALKCMGVEGWVPATAPSSTSFFGVDRTVHSRLGGLRYDATGVLMDEMLLEAEARVRSVGGKLTHFALHPRRYADLNKTLAGKTRYVDAVGGDGVVGFKLIEVQGLMGPVQLFADSNIPTNRAFGLDINSWVLLSPGEAIEIVEDDGLMFRRSTSADQYDVEIAFLGNLACNAPGHNINVQI